MRLTTLLAYAANYHVHCTSFHHCREHRLEVSAQGPTSKSAPCLCRHLLFWPSALKCPLLFPQSKQTLYMYGTSGSRQPYLQFFSRNNSRTQETFIPHWHRPS